MQEYIFHSYNNQCIRQRTKDGYFFATDICKAVNKRFKDFRRTKHA